MIITVTGFKGGVGKTTTAVHIAAYLERRKRTLLVDGDPNRTATAWAARGGDRIPFFVVDERQSLRYARDYENIVIDTKARPDSSDLKELAAGCDLLILPTTPDAFALDALMLTVQELARIGASRYRILLTCVPPKPSRDGADARAALAERDLPVFEAEIGRRVAFTKAALAGTLVSDVAHEPRAARGWAEYEAVSREIESLLRKEKAAR